VSTVKAWLKQHRRPLIKWTVIMLVLFLLAVPLVNSDNSPAPFDPKSTHPDGSKAFVMLMQQAGAQFSVGDAPGNGTAVLIQDTLSVEEAKRIRSWVEGGGRLIVADPTSSLTAATVTSSSSVRSKVLTPQCNASYVAGVRKIRPNTSANYEQFERDADAVNSCFPYRNGYFLSEHEEGAGSVIDIGSPDLFSNQDLANYDNAVLITNLVQPAPGKNIVWLQTNGEVSSSDSSGGSTLSQLLPDHVKEAFLQLIVAALVLILWRGRRLGKPVDEDPLVAIPASQLVVASGNLLETAGLRDDAAAMMRRHARQAFVQLLGVDANVSDVALMQIIHDRTNIAADRIEAVMVTMPAADDAQLITLAQQIEYLYTEATSAR
jgi:hypothetical protein